MGLLERIFGQGPVVGMYEMYDDPIEPYEGPVPPPPPPVAGVPQPDLIIGQTAITGMNWAKRQHYPNIPVVPAGSRARDALRGLPSTALVIVLITDPTSFDQPTWEALRWAARQCEVRFEVLP